MGMLLGISIGIAFAAAIGTAVSAVTETWTDTTAKDSTYAISDTYSWPDTDSGAVVINYMYEVS